MLKSLILIFLGILMKIFSIVLWGYCILSWVAMANPNLYRLYQSLSKYVEPVLRPFQKILMPLTMRIGVDFSPMLLAIVVPYALRLIAMLVVNL